MQFLNLKLPSSALIAGLNIIQYRLAKPELWLRLKPTFMFWLVEKDEIERVDFKGIPKPRGFKPRPKMFES